MNEEEKIIKESVDDVKLTEFFSVILGSKLITHVFHFQTKGKGSYAAHKALEEFYNTANNIADTIIETYQGMTGELVEFNADDLIWGLEEEPISYLKLLKEIVSDGREIEILEKSSNLQNEIDNFITLIDQTIYKLTFLE